jgi:hypothetical protein
MRHTAAELSGPAGSPPSRTPLMPLPLCPGCPPPCLPACLPQIWGRCVASANSPLALVRRGLQQWLDLGVPRAKLVLGVPW